jgi:hypothetical protein
MNDEARDVGLVELWKMGEFDQESSEISKTSAQDLVVLCRTQIWKGQLKITKPCAPLSFRKMKPKPREHLSRAMGHCARHGAEDSNDR